MLKIITVENFNVLLFIKKKQKKHKILVSHSFSYLTSTKWNAHPLWFKLVLWYLQYNKSRQSKTKASPFMTHLSLFLMMMMMNCFCSMVKRGKAFSLISSRGHCQRSSPLRISNTPQAGFEPAQNLSSGLVEWSCAVVITTTPRRYNLE